MRRLLLLSRLGSGRMVADSEIAISTTKHMAGTDAAPFLSYLGRLVSLNAPGACSFEIVESEIEILLAYRVLPCYFISSSAAIVSTPSHRFCKRRFSLAAC